MASELHQALGAGPPSGTLQVTLFVPSVDRNGAPIDQPKFAEIALAEFGRLFRGATSFPPGRGVWRDDDRGGQLVFDDTQMITSYAEPDALDDDGVLGDLRSFLHSFGRDARQGEIGIVIDGEYFGITDYDSEVGSL